MSDTPRTDAECFFAQVTVQDTAEVVSVELARTFERELESAHAAQRTAENELSRALAQHAMAEAESRHELTTTRAGWERECQDGDRLAEALGVSRTEGGSLNVPKMLAELEAVRKDAERYRWLTSQGPLYHFKVTRNVGNTLPYFKEPGSLDAAIDAAIAQQPRPGSPVSTSGDEPQGKLPSDSNAESGGSPAGTC